MGMECSAKLRKDNIDEQNSKMIKISLISKATKNLNTHAAAKGPYSDVGWNSHSSSPLGEESVIFSVYFKRNGREENLFKFLHH